MSAKAQEIATKEMKMGQFFYFILCTPKNERGRI
jgi:hypothetical protein